MKSKSKPKKSRSPVPIEEKETYARQVLKESGYDEKEIDKIIKLAFYQGG